MGLSDRLQGLWYQPHPLSALLLPLAWFFTGVVILRRQLYLSHLLNPEALPVPVIVIGNISAGGTGKTPLVIWLYRFLTAQGYKPGIVSRGYGGRARQWPQQVRPDSDPATVGDEAVLLARHTSAPIAVGPDRHAAAEALIRHQGCDLILCDDGLQHYALRRDIEIAVIDGIRRHGNGYCLPAGPLREPISRLRDVDIIVTHGLAGRGEFSMKYAPSTLQPVARSPQSRQGAMPGPQEVHAVAGIGNPDDFFHLLRAQGYQVHRHPFPDHHVFRREEINFNDDLPVIMTEKDAVKCERFAGLEHWYLPIEAELPAVFERRLQELLRRKGYGHQAAGDPGLPSDQGSLDL
jgi:tetraacyldisaccharide 4'-kinase